MTGNGTHIQKSLLTCNQNAYLLGVSKTGNMGEIINNKLKIKKRKKWGGNQKGTKKPAAQ
jgi:hypothetical protein